MKKYTLSLIFALILLTGCAKGPTYTEISPLKLNQANVQKGNAMSELSMAIARPEIKIKFNASNGLKSAIEERFKADAAIIACHLTREMRRILVEKGFTVLETYDSLNSMTFTQKRNTSAVFTAFIKINLDEISQTELTKDNMPVRVFGHIMSSSELSIATIEPLSGEIIWLKNVPVDDARIQIDYPYYPRLDATEFRIPNELVPAVTSLDKWFATSNDAILQGIVDYVSVEEFRFLNRDIEKLKDIKRY
jgi:hypothetical protein